jgi:hypothetical protein
MPGLDELRDPHECTSKACFTLLVLRPTELAPWRGTWPVQGEATSMNRRRPEQCCLRPCVCLRPRSPAGCGRARQRAAAALASGLRPRSPAGCGRARQRAAVALASGLRPRSPAVCGRARQCSKYSQDLARAKAGALALIERGCLSLGRGWRRETVQVLRDAAMQAH